MLGGLGRNDKHSEDNENDHDQAAAVSKKRTKKGVDGSVTVIEENVGSINVHSLDSEFEVDPLFKKTSAAFDEGGIESILLNHLTVDDDHYMLSLDSSSQLTLLNKPYLSSPSIICSSDLNVYFENLQSIQDNHICSTFANFTANAVTWDMTLLY
jgi:condensin complex subunit 2